MKNLIAAVWLALCVSTAAATNPLPHVYHNGFSGALKIGNDLYLALDPKFQKYLSPAPIKVVMDNVPIITPIEGDEEDRSLKQVSVSIGFIDLMNHIAHAKAIDRIQPGYFEKYVLNLARDATNETLPEVPNMDDDRYWTDAIMADQTSYFAQMFGMTAALNMSHHYLGHYGKYSNQMLAGKLVPINNLLTPAEWAAGMKAAAQNSLDCALGADGIKALIESIDKMPQRPAWTSYMVPQNSDLKKLNRDLTDYEAQYFHGGIK